MTNPQTNPVTLANMASNLARQAEDAGDARNFQRIAMISMVTVAVGTIMQITVPIIKDLLKSRHLPSDHFRTTNFDRDETCRRSR